MNKKFEPWAKWFASWESRQQAIPWGEAKGLTTAERAAIAPSIAVFQLGESSDGRNFYGKAVACAQERNAPAYAAALRDFIREENRHAALLGRLMDQEGMPRRKRSGSDGLFRFVRHVLPLRLSHRTLLTAEFVAVPYYRALAKASGSAILKTICKQILQDETQHIAFQSLAIRELSPGGRIRRWLEAGYARMALELALDLVWWGHSDLLQRGGYSFGDFRREAIEQLEWAGRMVAGLERIPEPIAAEAVVADLGVLQDTAQDFPHLNLDNHA
jgi:hypothetical protein